MLITRIELENIKSYRQISVEFRRGTTAISGKNGAGKTTLVEAIGFALFGYLPYNQEQFVREGEKYGRVVVHLIGSDDRPYTVERRCGSGARWMVHDIEANLRLEQRSDVQTKLHELFGIDHERPLDSLFRDALGVPQGTFTSIFLEPASKRKQTFDALLQIEDYKRAAESLLEAQRCYKEQMQTQQVEIQRLSYETRELESWRAMLQEAHQLDTQHKEQHVQWSQLLTRHEERSTILTDQLIQLNTLEQNYKACQTNFQHAQERLREREQQRESARAAQQIVTQCQSDYQRYQQAREAVKQLWQHARTRDELRSQHAKYQNELAKVEEKVDGWQNRLKEVATARELIVQLATQVDQQIELEKQRDEMKQRKARYDAIVIEGKRVRDQLAKVRQSQETLQKKIVTIEPLIPLAEKLQEHADSLTQLRIQASERSGKLQQLQEKRNLLREKQMERDQVTERLRKAERSVEVIEEHRQEAEEMPVLQEQYEALAAQKHRLEGNIEGYAKSRAQSAGGQCPLLHESCLNIKQRGIVSLEAYFENLLAGENEQLASINQQQATISTRMAQIKKYADALTKVGQYIERRDALAEHLQHTALDITRLERDVTGLTQDLEMLKFVEQRIAEAEASFNECKKADAQVRELTGLSKQVQQLQEQADQLNTDLQEKRQEAETLRDADERLRQIEAELQSLNDPRSRSKTQQAIVAQEQHFLQQLHEQQRRQQSLLQTLHKLDEQLAHYSTLDADIAQQEAIVQSCHTGYQSYLKNETEARLLNEREHAYQQQVEHVEQAEAALEETEQAYYQARTSFQQEELDTLKAEIARLRTDLAALAEKMQRHQRDINELEGRIKQAEHLLAELEAAQKEYQELEDLHTMMEHFRRLIKEAAPHVLKAMLGDISAEANRIFGEVMGDRTARLSWENDYEIILRRHGVNRTFAQLSGGEQMSAALSVRLALLKKLSTLNIAFFDEPTQNMDELRRMNLAEQIRRVRGFDQLIVISHDDTFEQGLDSLVRLDKVDGETYLQNDTGESMADLREQVNSYAS